MEKIRFEAQTMQLKVQRIEKLNTQPQASGRFAESSAIDPNCNTTYCTAPLSHDGIPTTCGVICSTTL